MSEEKANLKRRIESIIQRLSSMDLVPFGDLFSSDLEEIEKTVDCFDRLLDKLVAGYDFKIGAQSQIHALTIDNKSLNSKINSLKKQFVDENQILKEKVKTLQVAMQDKKKEAMLFRQEFEAEKSSWDNKLKQLNNELRKKDNSIKIFTDKAVANSIKGGKVVNGFEAIGEISRPGRTFYKEKSIEELNSSSAKHKELLAENQELKDLLRDYSDTLIEALKKRKVLLSGMDIEYESSSIRASYLEIKEDLHNLSLCDFKSVGLVVMRENMRTLFSIFDKIDSLKTRVPLAVFTSGLPDAEVDGIHEISQLREIVKLYKALVESQRKLIRTAIYNKDLDYNSSPIAETGQSLTGSGFQDRMKEVNNFKDRLLLSKDDFKRYSSIANSMIHDPPRSAMKA